MRRRRAGLAALVGGLVFLTPLAAGAQTVTPTPPPPGSAEAVAAEVEGLLAIAHTKAQVDQVTGEATANALELAGNPLLASTGGTQVGPGTTTGGLIPNLDLGVAKVAVAPFTATVEKLTNERRARAEAALARLVVLSPAVATIDLLQSLSEASHTDAKSTGASSTDGGVITLLGQGGLRIVLLHSEASTANGGSSFVIGLNDTKLISNKDIGNTLKVLDLPGLLTLGLVDVNGGPGSALVNATGVDLSALNSVNAIVTGAQAAGSPVAAAAVAPAPSELGAGDTTVGSSGGGGGLAVTGRSIFALLAVGLGLTGLGVLLYGFGRRRCLLRR